MYSYIITFIAIVLVGSMLIKKMDIKISLFSMGLLLMYVALLTGNDIAIKEFESTGISFLDPIKAIAEIFKSILSSSGFIIMILGGYSAYMSAISANKVTIYTLTAPIKKINSPYILVPIVFLLGNFLSLVIPSASNLSIILLATLYPILRTAGMSLLSAAAVIATTATIMPTPLGGDNVAIATELANHSDFIGLTVMEYVFRYHAAISIPTLIFMAIVHYFWQKYMDKKEKDYELVEMENIISEEVHGGNLFKFVYSILPVFPILLLIGVYIFQLATGIAVQITVEIATLLSFVIAILCELIRKRQVASVLKETESFFNGMGNSIGIVALLVSASVFVLGLNSIGLIRNLQELMLGINGSGLGFILPLVLVLLTMIIVLLSGSGTALFFALVPLMVPLSVAAGISPIAVTVPMGLAGNLMRAVSPVSAVVVIVAGTVKENPINIIKRTSVPMIAGLIFMFVLSMVLFL